MESTSPNPRPIRMKPASQNIQNLPPTYYETRKQVIRDINGLRAPNRYPYTRFADPLTNNQIVLEYVNDINFLTKTPQRTNFAKRLELIYNLIDSMNSWLGTNESNANLLLSPAGRSNQAFKTPTGIQRYTNDLINKNINIGSLLLLPNYVGKKMDEQIYIDAFDVFGTSLLNIFGYKIGQGSFETKTDSAQEEVESETWETILSSNQGTTPSTVSNFGLKGLYDDVLSSTRSASVATTTSFEQPQFNVADDNAIVPDVGQEAFLEEPEPEPIPDSYVIDIEALENELNSVTIDIDALLEKLQEDDEMTVATPSGMIEFNMLDDAYRDELVRRLNNLAILQNQLQPAQPVAQGQPVAQPIAPAQAFVGVLKVVNPFQDIHNLNPITKNINLFNKYVMDRFSNFKDIDTRVLDKMRSLYGVNFFDDKYYMDIQTYNRYIRGGISDLTVPVRIEKLLLPVPLQSKNEIIRAEAAVIQNSISQAQQIHNAQQVKNQFLVFQKDEKPIKGTGLYFIPGDAIPFKLNWNTKKGCYMLTRRDRVWYSKTVYDAMKIMNNERRKVIPIEKRKPLYSAVFT